jgi:Dolichyl-phosphate-mannose-protein mannosyltransferase
LSAVIHLWNPIGFPGIYFDESIYAERSIRILEGLGPQDPASRYDHPYFGQIFLGAMLNMMGYPDLLDTSSGDARSIETVYSISRILMGLLAVVDTFLLYKISEIRYNRRVAFIASILFAVMPLTWLTRRILLDSIMLPFILSSILFAVYYNKKIKIGSTPRKMPIDNKENKLSDPRTALILISGIFLGLAIFTKIPAFTFIPLVAYIISVGSRGNVILKRNIVAESKRKFLWFVTHDPVSNSSMPQGLKALLLWLVPVVLIPLFWPAYSLYIGELNLWLDPERGVLWQAQRPSQSLFEAVNSLYEIDSVFVVLGIVAITYTTLVKRDGFILLWILPFVVFFYFIGYTSYFHLIPLVPVFSIALAAAIVDFCERVTNTYKHQRPITDYILPPKEMFKKKTESWGDFYLLYIDFKKWFRFIGIFSGRVEILFILPLGVFGLMSSIVLVQTDVNSSYFATITSLLRHMPDRTYNSDIGSDGDNGDEITIIGSPRYFLILEHIFDKDYSYKSYNSRTPIQTQKNMIIVDDGVRGTMSRNEVIFDLYNTTRTIEIVKANTSTYDYGKYPFGGMKYNRQDPSIEIRSDF